MLSDRNTALTVSGQRGEEGVQLGARGSGEVADSAMHAWISPSCQGMASWIPEVGEAVPPTMPAPE